MGCFEIVLLYYPKTNLDWNSNHLQKKPYLIWNDIFRSQKIRVLKYFKKLCYHYTVSITPSPRVIIAECTIDLIA